MGMSKQTEALKLAMEALEEGNKLCLAIGGETSAVFDPAITAIREALEQPAPPPECKTDAEKTAFAFGWWKALEENRKQPEQRCNPHPKAPHGFDRNASHSADRYVCDCESWEPYDAGYQAGYEACLKREEALDAMAENASELGLDYAPNQQQEPVAWRSWNDHDGYGFWETKQEAEPWCAPDFFAEPLYTSPPAQRKPLTDEEIQEVVTKAVRERKLSWLGFKQDDQGTYNIPVLSLADYQFAHVIEAAHGIKGDA